MLRRNVITCTAVSFKTRNKTSGYWSTTAWDGNRDSGFQSLMRFRIPWAKLQIPKTRTPGKKFPRFQNLDYLKSREKTTCTCRLKYLNPAPQKKKNNNNNNNNNTRQCFINFIEWFCLLNPSSVDVNKLSFCWVKSLVFKPGVNNFPVNNARCPAYPYHYLGRTLQNPIVQKKYE